MKINFKRAAFWPIIIGVVLILVGLIIQIPGGALTTRESLDGADTDYYAFDDKYSAIDEYVGGDAYNFEIGASLVAGKTAGIITAKAILVVGGVICLTLGLILTSIECEAPKQSDSVPEFKMPESAEIPDLPEI